MLHLNDNTFSPLTTVALVLFRKRAKQLEMSLPSSFKAAVVPTPGAQHVVQDRSLSPLAEGEVAVKITATAINPVDYKARDGVSVSGCMQFHRKDQGCGCWGGIIDVFAFVNHCRESSSRNTPQSLDRTPPARL